MVSTSTLLVIVLGLLLGTIVLLGFGAFLFFILKSIRELTAAIDKAVEVFKPFTQGVGVSELVKSTEVVVKAATELGRRTDFLANTLGMIQKAIFSKGETAAPDLESLAGTAPATEGSSAFFAASDEDFARKEMERQLKARGIVVSEKEAFHPKEEDGVTTSGPES